MKNLASNTCLFIALTVAAFLAFYGAAMAQGINANANSNAAAQSWSGSASSNDGNNQNITFNSSDPADKKIKQKIENVPDVSAPPMYTTAPCYVGVSGGAGVMGMGVSLGGGIEDEDCTLRSNSHFLATVMEDKMTAKMLICMKSADMRRAYEMAGDPCPKEAAKQIATISYSNDEPTEMGGHADK